MPDVLVRGLDESTKGALAAAAAENGRSLQAELRLILEEAARSVVFSQGSANCTGGTSSGPSLPQFESEEQVQKRLEGRHLIRRRALETRESLAHDLPDPALMLSQMRAQQEAQMQQALENLTWNDALAPSKEGNGAYDRT
ncbi:MAG: FitA-like ribbon-helix-helix domain-containing protein [Eggerthellaceae bacterium]